MSATSLLLANLCQRVCAARFMPQGGYIICIVCDMLQGFVYSDEGIVGPQIYFSLCYFEATFQQSHLNIALFPLYPVSFKPIVFFLTNGLKLRAHSSPINIVKNSLLCY